MITYYNHTHMTAVPTRLLLDTNLSAEAKLTGALLYTFEDGGLSAQELANALSLPPEKVAMMGVAAAFSFLGMMFNVPLPGGTTGHAVGGTLIALLLGPYASCISVSIALLLQALLC